MDQNIMIFVLALIIPAIAQGYVSLTYSKYRKIKNNGTLTGYDVAREILDANDLKNIYIVKTNGTLSDHYDPTRKTVRLSEDIYNGTSVAAMAIAAHEVGHAIQDKSGYLFMQIRSIIFPVVSLGTKFAYIVLFAGVLLNMMDLIWLAIGLVGLGLIFQIITLPVEFNASRQAKEQLEKYKMVDRSGLNNVNKMLNAAALTYVAGVLASALEILRLALNAMDRK